MRISSEGTKNQRAHCYETDRSRALDTGGEKPDSNHGGVAVVGCDLYNQTITGETACTVTSACGGTNTSGAKVMAFEPGSASRVGGHVYEESTGALRAKAGDNQQAVCYGISAYDSNAMKSPNPHSGIYEVDTTRTLDLQGGNPACNQGGMAVVCIEGNGSRESHQGDGYKESETMYTLNTIEQHAVAYSSDRGGQEPTTASKQGFFLNARSDGKADTLVATDYKDPQIVCYGLDRSSFNQGKNAKFGFSVDKELAAPLVAKGPGGVFVKQ